jgi:hypothetical protein
MSNRPDPRLFAQASYTLAFISAFWITFALIPIKPLDGVRQYLMWVPLILSAVGAFLGYAARSDLKHTPADDNTMRKARVGWRVNLIIFVTMLLLVVTVIVLFVLRALPGV